MKILYTAEDMPDRELLKERLIREGYTVIEAEEAASGMAVTLRSKASDLVMMEIRLPGVDGGGDAKRTPEDPGDIPVIVITASTSVEQAIEALKLGAFDHVARPFDMDELLITVHRVLMDWRLRVRNRALPGGQFLVGRSSGMDEVRRQIESISRLLVMVVLVQGENGTGKDLVAKVIHARSSRADQPFVKITCTGLQEAFLEGELFGSENGSPPAASALKKGLFELAHGGTVFLDKIGDMGFALQAKLLCVLEEKSLKRMRGVQVIPVDVRVIASTDRDLGRLIEENKFREDLFHQLSAFTIEVPPLRERRQDVSLLTEHFLQHFSRELGTEEVGISRDGLSVLEGYDWPGNVRELRNVIERAVLLGGRPMITPDDLLLGRPLAPHTEGEHLVSIPPRGIRFDDLERDLVVQALERAAGDPARAGDFLGMTPDGIRSRMKKYGLLAPDTGP